jgi:hypothetical protein
MKNDHYILEGHNTKAVDLITWAMWFEKAERHVADDKVGDVRISTVFLGLDHSFGGGRPLIFETLVFGGPLDGEMERYSTWDEAEAGHKQMAKRIEWLTAQKEGV